MKKNFRIEHLGRSFKERLGIWIGEKKNVTTPALWIGCQGGAIPNLTPETIEYLNPNLQFAGVLVPFQYHVRDVDVLEKYGKGLLFPNFSGKAEFALKVWEFLGKIMYPLDKIRYNYVLEDN